MTSIETQPALQIDHLQVSFVRREKPLPVLRNVSLEIGRRESYGLVGESGCGKTTLALAVMHYLPRNGRVDAGEIRIDGEELLGLSPEELRGRRGKAMAMVYQDPSTSLNPSMRVGDQIAEVFWRDGLGGAEAKRQVRASLEKVAMPDPDAVMERYPFQLSGGQQQRVVIAMALAGSPSLLMLDEPTTGLDVTVEAEVLDLIEELKKTTSSAIMLISHNLGIVARMCARVGVMYAGRLVEEGPADRVLTHPIHPYTRALLRCVPRVGMNKDSSPLAAIPGTVPPLGAALAGCAFMGRCQDALPLCSTRDPEMSPLATYVGHRAACLNLTRSAAAGDESVPRSANGGRLPSALSDDGHGGTLLSTTDLRKTFRQSGRMMVAVDDVSIEIGPGETLGLVGESGSGKTTLARCVAGLLEPDAGVIELSSSRLAPAARHRPRQILRAVQMVFQNPDMTLNPSWTARAILLRAVRRLTELDGKSRLERMESLAERVALRPTDLARRPGELSGGQKQRIAIARAFAGNPSLVICDEPASALDVSVQATILNLLASLQAEQDVSYLFISHDLAVVRYLADRIAVMYLAWLMEVGSAEDVLCPPHHPYTEALVSAIPTLDFGAVGRRIVLEGSIPSPSDPPGGCRFHTRCHRRLGTLCSTEAPPWRDLGGGHQYRCHIPGDELRNLQRAGS